MIQIPTGDPFFVAFLILLVLIFIGLLYVSLFRQRKEAYQGSPDMSVLVMLPCRGVDFRMEDNLRSLTKQKYGNFKIIAIVDAPDDPSTEILRKVGIEFIISDAECRDCSGKVRAIVTAFMRYNTYDAYVIADSDMLCSENWLADLVSPLINEDIGISTTFPYFKPVGGFWTTVKMVWGFVGLGMMESNLTRFGWGGSLAFRRSLLDGSGLLFFRDYVSDDIALTKICKSRGLKIAYVPEAGPVIRSPENYRQFMEWANRQTALSIYATRNVFRYGVIYYGGTILLFVSSLVLSVYLYPLYILLLIPMFVNAYRTYLRARDRRFAAFLLSFALPFIYLSNLIRARMMKSIVWRGREYILRNNSSP